MIHSKLTTSLARQPKVVASMVDIGAIDETPASLGKPNTSTLDALNERACRVLGLAWRGSTPCELAAARFVRAFWFALATTEQRSFTSSSFEAFWRPTHSGFW